jgi:hypothetical protein
MIRELDSVALAVDLPGTALPPAMSAQSCTSTKAARTSWWSSLLLMERLSPSPKFQPIKFGHSRETKSITPERWIRLQVEPPRRRPTSKKRASSPSNHRRSPASQTGVPRFCSSTATTIAIFPSSKQPTWSKNCAPKTSRSKS